MSVKGRKLEPEICYIFNGRDFIINNTLPAVEYQRTLSFCLKNDSDSDEGKEGGLSRLPAPLKKFQHIGKKEGNKKKHVEKTIKPEPFSGKD